MSVLCFSNDYEASSTLQCDVLNSRNPCVFNFSGLSPPVPEPSQFRSLDNRTFNFSTAADLNSGIVPSASFTSDSSSEDESSSGLRRAPSAEHLDQYVGTCGQNINCQFPTRESTTSSPLPASGTCGTISAEELFMKLQTSENERDKPLVLLDIRENRLYHTSHIVQARSASCHTKMMVKRAVATWSVWYPDPLTRGGKEVVIYDQRSDVPTTTTGPLKLYITHLRILGNDVHFLEGGLDNFMCVGGGGHIESNLSADSLRKHAHSPTSTSEKSEDVLNATASKILPFLYLGNERDTNDSSLLESLGITHILNATNSVPFYLESTGRYRYHRLPATDCQRQDLRQYFTEAFQFINDAQSSGGKVLVHCWAGVSRSATIVMAYLLRCSSLPLNPILQFVRGKRSIVAPNFNFMGQLERYHAELDSHQAERKAFLNRVITNQLDQWAKQPQLPLFTPRVVIDNPFLK